MYIDKVSGYTNANIKSFLYLLSTEGDIPEVLTSEAFETIISTAALSAVQAYHNELRKTLLLKYNIEIGGF